MKTVSWFGVVAGLVILGLLGSAVHRVIFGDRRSDECRIQRGRKVAIVVACTAFVPSAASSLLVVIYREQIPSTVSTTLLAIAAALFFGVIPGCAEDAFLTREEAEKLAAEPPDE